MKINTTRRDVVEALTSGVTPIGETTHDIRSRYNLGEFLSATDSLVTKIIEIRELKFKYYEGSIQDCAGDAEKYLKQLKEELEELFYED